MPTTIEDDPDNPGVKIAQDGTKWVARPGTDDQLAFMGHEAKYAPVFHMMVEAVPEDGLVCVVGAHVGTWAVRFAGLRPVLAFEANPSTAQILLKNVWLNQVENKVEILNFAAWDSAGLEVGLHDENGQKEGGSTRVVQYAESLPMATTTTLDWQRHYRPRIGFVLMDVEGAEAVVLRGAHDLLTLDRPHMSIELHEGLPGVDPNIREQVEKILEAHAYRWRSEIEKGEEHLICWPGERTDPTALEFLPEGV